MEKHVCPVNGKSYKRISTRTVTHHVRQSWELDTDGKTFYFCDDPDCDVVYFSNDNSVITKTYLRTQVGIKTSSEESMLCYCYGITMKDFIGDSSVRNFVVQQTKPGLCSCETSNPSGKCCLKDFPKIE
ncbi:MAG: hypothetical protein ABW105_14325 [Candidatus Thiodiazotropha sp. 6PLUC1]